MNNAILKLIAVIRIMIGGRCRSKAEADRLNGMLDQVEMECKAMQDDGK